MNPSRLALTIPRSTLTVMESGALCTLYAERIITTGRAVPNGVMAFSAPKARIARGGSPQNSGLSAYSFRSFRA